MNFIENIKELAKNNQKRIILTESEDKRVVEAASIASLENIADVILLGDINDVCKFNFDISKIQIINPKEDKLSDELALKLYELRKNKGLSKEEAVNLIKNDYIYFACMMVKLGMADGIVSGACHSTANTLRPALQIIKAKDESKLVSAFFLMDVPKCNYGDNGVFIFADSGLVQNPSSEELAYIARDSADSFELLTGHQSITAFLSHSTMGSASSFDVSKVINAVNIAKVKFPNYIMDGELQLDAAIVPEIALSKAPNSKIKGNANVLIFPNLDSGNIGYKLVQRLAKAQAYGPITQGINNPVNDLSRGCSTEDIIGVIAITAVQASKK